MIMMIDGVACVPMSMHHQSIHHILSVLCLIALASCGDDTSDTSPVPPMPPDHMGKTKDPPWYAPVHVNPPVVPDNVPIRESDYERRFRTLEIRPEWRGKTNVVVTNILNRRSKYSSVSATTNVPWYVIGALHNMESSLRFDRHLHNGNPLTGKTYWVPKGRIPHKDPPYTWEESADDALKYDKLHQISDWSLHHMLYTIERYNGLGYLKYHKDVPSPYLWSGSQHYIRGKYVADGKWNPSAVSQQVGAAVIIKELENRGVLSFNR